MFGKLRSIFVFNDAVFSDEDFAGICSVGASVKRTDFAKIGRYGLGFNTVYKSAFDR